MTPASVFRCDVHALQDGVSLEPFPAAEALALGAAFAVIDPWRRLGFAAERLAEFFAAQDAGSARFAIRTGGALAGFVCVEPKWLSGPYLHFLGVLPAHQGRGIGTSVVDWFVGEARAGQDRNAWVCVSHFNTAARALYAQHGFSDAAMLPDVIETGEAEILMRKQLFPSGKATEAAKK